MNLLTKSSAARTREDGDEPEASGAAADGAGADANTGSVGEMKSGEYMIHVYVEECKEINVKDGETVDPMVVVECLG